MVFQDLIQLASDYLAHNISVGAIDVDSTWETGFNDFIPDTATCVSSLLTGLI